MTGRVKKRTGIEPALARSEEPVLPDIGNPPWAACTIPARDVSPSRAVPADKLYPEWTYPVNIPIACPAPRLWARSGLPAAGTAAHGGDFHAQGRCRPRPARRGRAAPHGARTAPRPARTAYRRSGVDVGPGRQRDQVGGGIGQHHGRLDGEIGTDV